MRYPNLRYGNPTALRYYSAGHDLKSLAKRLRRGERTVRDWISERARVPWWVPEIMRLWAMEQAEIRRQMGGESRLQALGIVRGSVIEMRARPEKKKPQITDLRLDEFDQVPAPVISCGA